MSDGANVKRHSIANIRTKRGKACGMENIKFCVQLEQVEVGKRKSANKGGEIEYCDYSAFSSVIIRFIFGYHLSLP